MNQSLSLIVVSLQSLGRGERAYFNMLIFILEIFEKNISYKYGSSVDYHNDYFGNLLSISQKCSSSPAELIRFHYPLGFYVCLYDIYYICVLYTYILEAT